MMEIRIDKIPSKGLVMAYFKDKLVFSSYEVTKDGLNLADKALFDVETPYECHFFDAKTEYRMVKRESRSDFIHRILTKEEEDAMVPDLIFTEDVLVKEEYASLPGIPKKLRIINRYRYSENDTLTLQDYRMALIPEEGILEEKA